MIGKSIADRWDAGEPAESFTPAERAELRRAFMTDSPYWDPKHPDHQGAVAAVAELYEADHPPEADE